MRFLTLLSQLRDEYGDNIIYTDNQVCLLGPSEPPYIADHFLYSPMPKSTKQQLVQSYHRHFPVSLLMIYDYANGLDLFRTMRNITKDISLPGSRIRIWGVPILVDRQHLEPLNICLEDLDRLPDTPGNWLKFGCFNDIQQGEIKNEYDLYVSVDEDTVYLVERQKIPLSIVKTWASIDNCLCDLFNTAQEHMDATPK